MHETSPLVEGNTLHHTDCSDGSTLNIRPVHEAVRAVVQRQSQDAHVVRVQHPVAEPDALPLAHEAGRTPNHLHPWVGQSVKSQEPDPCV